MQVSSEQFQTTPLTPGRPSAEAAGRPARKAERERRIAHATFFHLIDRRAPFATVLALVRSTMLLAEAVIWALLR